AVRVLEVTLSPGGLREAAPAELVEVALLLRRLERLRLGVRVARVLQRLGVVRVLDRVAELPHRPAVPDLDLLRVGEQAHLLQLIAGGPGPLAVALVVTRLVPGDPPEEVSELAEVDQVLVVLGLHSPREPDPAPLLERGMEAAAGLVVRDGEGRRELEQADLVLPAELLGGVEERLEAVGVDRVRELGKVVPLHLDGRMLSGVLRLELLVEPLREWLPRDGDRAALHLSFGRGARLRFVLLRLLRRRRLV